MVEETNGFDKLDQPLSVWVMLILTIYAFVLFSLFVFLPSGDLGWIQGWVFSITLTVNFMVSYMRINNRNPRVLRNRMKVRKTGLSKDTQQAASSDRFIYPLMVIGYFGAIVLPGIGHRFGWYELPFAIAFIGVVIMNLGLVVVNVATLHNSYASKLLDINQDQVLVDTGLYSHVRHPLYAGAIIMILATPIALGSLWGLLPALLAALTLMLRIVFEEEMLLKGMEGYEEYQTRVKYKLIPRVY